MGSAAIEANPKPIGERRRSRDSRDPRQLLDSPWVLRLAGTGLVLVAWELWFRLGGVSTILSAPPTKVVRAVPSVVTSPQYVDAALSTLRLFAIGFLISVVLGVLFGFLLARVRLLDDALTPYVNAIYASPLPALIPIITAALGFAFRSKLLIVVLLGVFPVLINAQQGAKDVDPTHLEVARSFRASEVMLWRDVIFPSSLPYLAVGLRLGAARAMIGTVVAELYTSPEGLGYEIIRYSFRFDMDSMFVIVLTFTFMSLGLSVILRRVERRLAPWAAE